MTNKQLIKTVLMSIAIGSILTSLVLCLFNGAFNAYFIGLWAPTLLLFYMIFDKGMIK